MSGVVSKRISRGKLLDFFAAHPSCTVALKACGGAHHWARQLRARSSIAASEAGQMAASDYVPNLLQKPLALGGASTDEYTP